MKAKNIQRKISLFLILALVFWLAGAVSVYASNAESVGINEPEPVESNEQDTENSEDLENGPANHGNPHKNCGDGYIIVAKYEWVNETYVAEFGEDIVTITDGTSAGGYWTANIAIYGIRLYGGKDNKFIEYKDGAYEGFFSNEGMLDTEGETPEISNIIFCTIDTTEAEPGAPEDYQEEPGDEEEPEDSYNFGKKISEIAQGLESGQSTVEELVKEATSIHLVVLANVFDKVPDTAKSSIKKAMEKAPGSGPGTGNEAEEEEAEEEDDKENEDKENNPSKNIAAKKNNPSKNKGK